MSRLTRRALWRQAVTSDAFPTCLRVIRGTLLCVVDLMSADGELAVYREQIKAVTGLPVRTIDRHLARAVDAGWLVHEQHGGQGRRSVYRAEIPTADSAPQLARYRDSGAANSPPEVARYSATHLGDSAPSTRGLSLRNSAPSGGALNKESANDSERVAVNDHRGRRPAPEDGRVQPKKQLTSDELRSSAPTPHGCSNEGDSLTERAREGNPTTCRRCATDLPRGLLLLGRSEHLPRTCPSQAAAA